MGEGRIMFVDDDELIVAMTSATLRRMGRPADVFSDPGLALEAFSRAPARYDLVICDVQLGTVDGLDVARKLRSIAPAVRILLVSGAVDPAHAAAARGLGVLGPLPKAEVMTNLADVIARCTG